MKPVKIAVILAGGRASRMGGIDKGALLLAGRPLIQHVTYRLSVQTDVLWLSGPISPHTGLHAVEDDADGPPGPVGAIFTLARAIRASSPSASHFTTAPADGPFLPMDLIERFLGVTGSAIASDGARDHPTFARWRIDDVLEAKPLFDRGRKPSLFSLAEACQAERVCWHDEQAFFNVNTLDDLKRAEDVLKKSAPTETAQ